MSEVTFAKAFLVTLDKKPIKLPADHVSDPRKYLSQSPYILPKQTSPFPKKDAAELLATANDKTITVTIKPMRTGATVTLDSIPIEHTIHDVKLQYAQTSSQDPQKIKLLYNKKPAADLKTLKELGIEKDVELSAMVIGGAATESPIASPAAGTPRVQTPTPKEDKMEIDSSAPHPGSEKAQVQVEEAGTATTSSSNAQTVLESAEFWSDLEGFLSQRLRDQDEAGRLAKVFKNAWASGL